MLGSIIMLLCIAVFWCVLTNVAATQAKKNPNMKEEEKTPAKIGYILSWVIGFFLVFVILICIGNL